MSYETKTTILFVIILIPLTCLMFYGVKSRNERWAEEMKLQREHEIKILELKVKLREDK